MPTGKKAKTPSLKSILTGVSAEMEKEAE